MGYINVNKVRFTGVAVVVVSFWYLYWLLTTLNTDAPLVSYPFLIASVFVFFSTLLSVLNHWDFHHQKVEMLPKGKEARVAVLIPVCGEPVEMILNTVKSVIGQDYDKKMLLIATGDDGHSDALKLAIGKLASVIKSAKIVYMRPPAKFSPFRRGHGKAGNLNALYNFVRREHPEINFIETRDADDLVGDKYFLRHCVGQMLVDKKVSFVQTIKECIVSDGDPFGNMEQVFYRRDMVAKNAFNSAFPCGSGLVWRKSELEKIGGFPTWNLVEDLQSGFDICTKGGKGVYLPIVGAVGQIAPEDIANYFKQRGTWAVDSLRLFLWKNPFLTRGLTIAQRLQFLEVEVFYLLGFTTVAFMILLSTVLMTGIYPVNTSILEYTLNVWLFLAVNELFVIARGEGVESGSVWKSRQMWIGLAPVYIKAFFLALLYGPNRKPRYKVTRKFHMHSWYWKETLPQLGLMLLMCFSALVHVLRTGSVYQIDFASLFWAGFYIAGLSRIVQNSVRGTKEKFLNSIKMPNKSLVQNKFLASSGLSK